MKSVTSHIVRTLALPVVLLATVLSAHAQGPGGAQGTDIREFVHRAFIEGVPYGEASQLGTAVVPDLLRMLGDPGEELHWANIVVTLGMIGDERAVAPLVTFIEEPSRGPLSRPGYTARTSAIMALGYLVNATGSPTALEYLTEGLDPATWSRRVAWQSPHHPTEDARNEALSEAAMLGLALSGSPEAGAALRALEASAEAAAPRLAAPDTREQRGAPSPRALSTALAAHEAIARQGLAEYYRESERESADRERRPQ